ncbi:MAG: DUF3622 domain-containing protein [Candidatus Polarisedimenticolaceae bacterium]|nr:DUF3622 domain-containing protein [Candidatus Polarisedimenticolaceae bacterium]
MAKSKKYDCRVVRDASSWVAEIVRRVTAKESIVSKRQDGFATEAEAEAWGQNELKSFLGGLSERNKRHAKKRASAAEE